MIQDAPTGNGVMELTEAEILDIREDLRVIRDSFVPDMMQSTVTIQYIVSEYNEMNVGKEINGDTASFILGYMTEEELQSQEQEPVAE